MYFSLFVVRVMKSRRMRWVEQETCIRNEKSISNVSWKGPYHLGNQRCRHEDNIKMDIKKIRKK